MFLLNFSVFFFFGYVEGSRSWYWRVVVICNVLVYVILGQERERKEHIVACWSITRYSSIFCTF